MAKKKKQVGRPLSWRAYSREYNTRKKQLAKEGLEMKERKLTASEFRFRYQSLKSERLEAIEKGERKTIGNITRDIVKSQEYSFTQKQARAIRNAYAEYNRLQGLTGMGLPTIKQIRHNTAEMENFWDAVENERTFLTEMGFHDDGTPLSAWEINRRIAQTFFGSI